MVKLLEFGFKRCRSWRHRQRMNPNQGAPRETLVNGQARKARRVTGPLAGAVLGPTVGGGCERGGWHGTTTTAGLFNGKVAGSG